MSKGPEAFRTISEVAGDLDLPQHVLRFWETRFSQIRPMKRGGGRRYYRPDDIDLLRGIRHLLYGEGYTIRGVQRILRDQGPRFVSAVGRGEAEAIAGGTDEPGEAEARSISGRDRLRIGGAEAGGDSERPKVDPAAIRERARPQRSGAARHRADSREAPSGGTPLSREEVRRLQATLFELLECKRLLDQMR